MVSKLKILVTGAGGFIGGHLVADLVSRGNEVIAVDLKSLRDWHQVNDNSRNLELDLREKDNCLKIMKDIDYVYNLAADMGGMGFIENNKAACMLSVLINTNLLIAAREYQIKKYFFASSACVYAQDLQTGKDFIPLKESHAYPAMPEDGYGWEKLFSERMCRHFREDYGVATRIARFHNVYGPYGTYEGGREKVPAAICRKVALAKLKNNSEIEIWGDGNQLRSFMWIDDCIRGIQDVTDKDYVDPVNLGSSETVSINQLVSAVEEIAQIKLVRNYIYAAPQGVRARTSDNTQFMSRYGWEPSTPLQIGLEKTYRWIYNDIKVRYAL